MLEGLVEQYLLRYLGDYIFGVDKQNLSVTTWRGEIHLRSARLKQEVVELLNLPFRLLVGEAADLKISVPWNRLGSRPVVVELTGLRVLLGPKPSSEWSNEEELRRVQLARQRLVDRADLLSNLDDRKEGYLERLVTRISDNLELQLRDLHIRFQDETPAAGGPQVFGGFHLASLEVHSTGADWQRSFVERSDRTELFKLLRLRDLSCFHEPPGWARRLPPQWTDEDFRRCFDHPEAVQLTQGRLIYLLPPCSGQLKLTQALAEKPRFDLQCQLEPIQVRLSATSYGGLCGIMSLVSEYFAFQEVTRHWIQSYWPHRPLVPVEGNALLWWRYALRCIRAAAAKRAPFKAAFSWLLTEENLSRLRLQAEYSALAKSRGLSEHEQARLQRLRVWLSPSELLLCHAAMESQVTSPRSEVSQGRSDSSGRRRPSVAALEVPKAPEPLEIEVVFKHKPSVGTWLMRRPIRIAASIAKTEGLSLDCETETKKDVPAEGEDTLALSAWPQDFRFKPSVGTWLHARPFRPVLPEKPKTSTPERSWWAWLRFEPSESSSWLWRRRPRPEAETEKVQSSSWMPTFRWFSSEEKEPEEPSPGESPKPPTPKATASSPSHQSAWRVWFAPGSGTDPKGRAPSPREEERQVRPVAFTEAVLEAPLRLALELPEVVVEMQTQEHVKVIGLAKQLRLSVLAGDDFSTKAEVVDLQLLVRCSQTPVETCLLHVTRPREQAICLEYISRDSQGQPWISIKAEKLVLFYQLELLQQLSSFFATQRGFDRWRRRAKALLYKRGRPRCQLQLADQTLLVPTRPLSARAAQPGSGPVLALRAKFVDAVSREVTLQKEEMKGFQLVRVDRWTVDCNGLQLLHFPSYHAFMAGRPWDWELLQESKMKFSCLAKRFEEPLPPALLAFAWQPQVLTSTEAEGDIESLALSFNGIAYDSFIRAFRLLLRGSGSTPSPAASQARGSQVSPPPFPEVEEPVFLERAQSVYSILSEDGSEEALKGVEGALPSFKRIRFTSAASGLESTPMRFTQEPTFSQADSRKLELRVQIGVISMRFHCLPRAIEIKGSRSVLSFNLFSGFARLGLELGLLEMSAERSLMRAESEEKAQVSLLVVAAWEEEAKAEAEGAELRIAVDLCTATIEFSPLHFREFISFLKTTPPGALPPPGDPLLWRIRGSFSKGVLQWVDEANDKVFAESRMEQSSILLDLHQETLSFSSCFENFSIQDMSSARWPVMLRETLLQISARTFTHDFRGYHMLVSIAFRSARLQYMGQKFVKCWQWVFGAFLPALTAGRKLPESDEDSRSSASSASFVSIEDGEPKEPKEAKEAKAEAKELKAEPKAESKGIDPELFIELAEGDFASGLAWEAAEKALREMQPQETSLRLTRLHVAVEDPVITIPLETGGQDKEPAVEIRARRITASNGPCRRQNRKGLVDALALSCQEVSISEGVQLFGAPQDMSIHIDLNLPSEATDTPLPLHVLWQAPLQLDLSSRSLALLRAAFSKNVAGIDPDVAQTPAHPGQLSNPSDFPVWLVFRLLFRNFKLRILEGEDTLAELGAKQLLVEVKKHAAPRTVVSFGIWEARLSSSLPAPFNQLLCKRPMPKASARGRKGPSIHGDYTSDHAQGQSFEIHGSWTRVLLKMNLLRRCWAWMFPPQPWFTPPLVMERPSSDLRVTASLHDAHVLLVETEEKEEPLISVLTDLKYQLESHPLQQKWSITLNKPEVFYTAGWQGVVDIETRDPAACRSLATAKEMAFQVANAQASQGDTLARRLSCQDLCASLSNRDFRLWVACVQSAWKDPAETETESAETPLNSIEFNFDNAKVTFLSEYDCGSSLPFLELRSSELCVVYSQRGERRISGRAALSLWLFNPLAAAWEPLLEGQAVDEQKPRHWSFKVLCKNSPCKGQPTRNSVTIESADRLLLTVSDLCWRVLPALSAPWLSPDKVTARPIFSPYAVRNDLATAVTLLLHDSRVRLESSSEQRLEQESLAGMRRKNRMLTVQLDGRFLEVEDIPLDRLGRRIYTLRGALTRSGRSSSEQALQGQLPQASPTRRKGLGRAASHPSLRLADAKDTRYLEPPYMVCRVQAKEAYKILMLEPPARIINQLSLPVHIRITGHQDYAEVAPKGSKALPVDWRSGFFVRPAQGSGWSREFRFDWLSNRQVGPFRCEDQFNFCIDWHTELIPHQATHDSYAPQHIIHLCAPVTLVSALPVACQFEVESTSDWTRDLAAGERCEIHSLAPDELSLRLAVFGHWSLPLQLRHNEIPEKVSIAVPVDGSKTKFTHFQCFITWCAPGKPLTIVVHSPTWIADHVCSQHLKFAYQAGQEKRWWVKPFAEVAQPRSEGNPRMLPLDCRATHVAFRLKDHQSEAQSLTAVGSGQVYLKASGSEEAHPDGLLLGLRFTEHMEAGLEVRVLHVAPLQVAVNDTERSVSFRQAPSGVIRHRRQAAELEPGQRLAVHWCSHQELLIQARIWSKTWSRWSGRLPAGSVGEHSFQCYWEKEQIYENFRVEVRQVDATTYIVFREAGNAPILLKNLSSEPLLFQQEPSQSSQSVEDSDEPSGRKRWFQAGSLTSSSHSTPEIAVQPRRGVMLMPGETLPFAWAEPLELRRLEVRSCKAPLVVRLLLEKTEKSLPLPITSQPLFYDVVASGPSLVMTVRDSPRPALDESQESLEVNVNMAGLGLSLVAPTSCAFTEAEDDVRRELLLCSVEHLVGSFRRNALETLELSFQEVQVDNQREDAMHPVLLKRRGEGKEDGAPLLHVVVSCFRDPQRPQLLDFDRLEVKLRSIDLRLDQGFIFDMMALVQSIRGCWQSAPAETPKSKEGLKLHFNHLKLDRAKIGVSFAVFRPGRVDVAFWKQLLRSLSSVDRALLSFEEYTLQDTTADAENFLTALRGHYYNELMRELKWVVGRLEVLGTPATFCGSVARSCKEGALATYKGATRSEEDMLEGCLLGTAGCVRNTLFECFNSISKASGAASQGCRMCLPEDFRTEGSPCGFGALVQGVRGLGALPLRGCRAAGLRGCAKGSTQGLVGCVGGIMVGCLDMTRDSAESLRNGVLRMRPGRRRAPRPLYGVERALRSFDRDDAELKARLVSMDPSLASMALVQWARDDAGNVVAAASDVYFLHLHQGKLMKVPLEDIVEMEVSEKAIRLERSTGVLYLEDDEQRCRIAARLLGACLGNR